MARHSLGRPSFGEAPFEKEGANIIRPRDQETSNGNNENDGVSKRVHELAFGVVICFESL